MVGNRFPFTVGVSGKVDHLVGLLCFGAESFRYVGLDHLVACLHGG